MAIRHCIITRFNTRPTPRDTAHVDDRWLDERFDLFDRYCLPSVRSQTNRDFRWMLFAHPDTAEAYKARLRAAADDVVYVDVMRPEDVRQAVRAQLTPADDLVVTQRLDNDDAISPDFVARLQAAAPGPARFLNFERGYQFDTTRGRLYRRREISNPFIAYVEPATDAPVTVYQGIHTKLVTLGPSEQLPGRTWVQVIHGGNALNQLRGVRCSAAELAPFAVSPERVAPDDLAMRLETVTDTVTLTVKRLRDRAARVAHRARERATISRAR